jgi:cation diffusion facilitator CzcD-associated flavoprotein CzcO
VRYTCSFLYLCSGYYSADVGHVVDFPGQEDFGGRIVHVANRIRAYLPSKLAYRVIRTRNIVRANLFYQYFRLRPARAAALLRGGISLQIGDSVPIDPHFSPDYAPWDQRLCLVPDGDLFKALKAKRASMVTDRIERFTPRGIELVSGEELDADIIVIATGLKMVSFGQISLVVDGTPVDPGRTLAYQGMMFDGVPNLAWSVGYTNQSWTTATRSVSRGPAWIRRAKAGRCST